VAGIYFAGLRGVTDETSDTHTKAKRRIARPAWWAYLKKNGDGIPYANELNVMTALEHAPDFSGSLQYDEFADQIKVLKPLPWHVAQRGPLADDWTPAPWRESDRIELSMWLQSAGLMVNKSSVVQDAVIATAKRHGVHPLRSLLTTLGKVWDQVPRLDTWLIDYLGACDNPQYLKAVGPAFLIGAVARIMNPGCQMDTILVLEAQQGARKTSVVRLLAQGSFADLSHDLTSKDAAILIQGVWICEMSELTALARSKVEEVKAFISRIKDRYRPPYGRNAEDRPRQTVFIATTNEVEYLQDPTGARRFWPVDCRAINLDRLTEDVQMLWAEAVARWYRSERWHLPRSLEPFAYREQTLRRRVTPLETAVMIYVDAQRKASVPRIDMRTILRDALQVDPLSVGPAAGAIARDVSRVLNAHGWIKERPRGRGQNRVVYYVYLKERDPSFVMDDSPPDPPSQAPSQAPDDGGFSL
jgi:putative DNA primase/helicase